MRFIFCMRKSSMHYVKENRDKKGEKKEEGIEKQKFRASVSDVGKNKGEEGEAVLDSWASN